MGEQESDMFQLSCSMSGCLEAVAESIYNAFDHYSSRLETSLRQRPNGGLVRICRIVLDLNRLKIALATMAYYNKRMLNELYDCMRLFAGLEHMDFERAVWNFVTSPQNCDRDFLRLVEFSSLLSSFDGGSKKWCECYFCSDKTLPGRGCLQIEALGSALWQVSCHIPRSLSPSPPPPPYTLYAFNIELPPIRYPAVTTPRSSEGQTLGLGKRRRSNFEDVETLRPSMRRICDAEEVEEIRPERHTGLVWEDIEDEDEHPAKRRLLNEPENVEYIREQRLLRFQSAA